MSRGRIERVLARRLRAGGAIDEGRRPDELIVEEPLEIRLDDRLVATTMRTPGHDFELAIGLCHNDGLLGDAPVVTCRYCATGSATDTEFNVVSVDTAGLAPEPPPRLGTTSSACGICGTTQLDDLTTRLKVIPDHEPWAPSVLLAAVDAVREHQDLFARTGAVHAAASFDRQGAIDIVREDIGRHNAVDKVIGASALAGDLPLHDRVLMVSGRAGFEIVQKAAVAGIPVLAAVSAPSSLAADAAERLGMTLVGFLRGDGFNVYCGAERIAGA